MRIVPAFFCPHMPIYAFACSACGHAFDRLQKLSDPDPQTCPACGAQTTVQRQLTAPSFRLAGSGWYETDFKKDGDRKRNLAGDSADAGKSADSGQGDSKLGDSKLGDSKQGDSKQGDSKPADAKPDGTKRDGAKSGESKHDARKTASPKPESQSGAAAKPKGDVKTAAVTKSD